jgi:hypothetical protein
MRSRTFVMHLGLEHFMHVGRSRRERANENCLVSVGCNNMGEYNMSKCWIEGDHVVMVGAGAFQARPTAMRSTLRMSADEFEWTGHAVQGTDDPYKAFTGTLKRVGR